MNVLVNLVHGWVPPIRGKSHLAYSRASEEHSKELIQMGEKEAAQTDLLVNWFSFEVIAKRRRDSILLIRI